MATRYVRPGSPKLDVFEFVNRYLSGLRLGPK